MPTHGPNTRQAGANAVVDRLDLGSTNASAQLVLLSSGAAVVATLPMSAPPTNAFGDADTNGRAVANPITSDSNAAGGTVATFALRDRDNEGIVLGTVTLAGGGGDLIASALTIPAGATVSAGSVAYNFAQ